jgi:hypothetical protein
LACVPKKKKKESKFDKLTRLIKEEGEQVRRDLRDQIGSFHTEVNDKISGLRKETHDGFAGVNRRLDHVIQMQLDEHAKPIKKLETAVFSK